MTFFLKNTSASVVKTSISNKYFDIFSKPVLLNADIEQYRKIILYQETCNWKLANKYILKLKNEILMGYVLAQRYLHPRCYRSQFLELSNWLKMYNDLPQAKRIYRLAIKRMPKGFKKPPAPSKVVGIKVSNFQKKIKKVYKSKLKLTKNQQKEKRKLINSIKSRVNKGWPTGAVKILNQRDVKTLLDRVRAGGRFTRIRYERIPAALAIELTLKYRDLAVVHYLASGPEQVSPMISYYVVHSLEELQHRYRQVVEEMLSAV